MTETVEPWPPTDWWEAGLNNQLIPGEYVFECAECDATGQIAWGDPNGAQTFEPCEDCFGEGKVNVDEEEAVDFLVGGAEPTSWPHA